MEGALMGSVVALDTLFDQRRVWKGKVSKPHGNAQPTGLPALDAVLPSGGWPDSALSEVLLPAEGCGELHLLWPTLARLTQRQERVVLVAPPHIPYPHAWLSAGVDLRWLTLIEATPKEALWAAEQCLRSGSCGAVLCWPDGADDRALRRLQVAAETGQTLAFAMRPLQQSVNPSPAALRLCLETRPARVSILKCRGGLAPDVAIPLAVGH
jgi:hypothetical protein